MAIKRKTKNGPVFTFNRITKEDIVQDIKHLDAPKASQGDNMPTKKIKENSDIFSNFIYQSFNNMIDVCSFPASLKLANITPVCKKKFREFKRKLQAGKYLAKYLKKFTKKAYLSKYQITFKINFSEF